MDFTADVPTSFAADLDASIRRRARLGDLDSCASWFTDGYAPLPRESSFVVRTVPAAAILFLGTGFESRAARRNPDVIFMQTGAPMRGERPRVR